MTTTDASSTPEQAAHATATLSKPEAKATKISRMVLRGFKSFALKTDILFTDGFNCVLGPNGSGKSNILDALCFVLGKTSAKGLRAEKSANLIYNGGKAKTPAKEGEVAIAFDNGSRIFPVDTPEVVLSRTIRQNGTSVYRINGEVRTRQEVVELLSHARIDPDGHNVILQGDIVHMVEMPPVERRGLVEEVAGLSVYEERKEKALRELQRVDERLTEADIILTERAAYLKELKKERDQAQKFKDLDENIKRNKATLLDSQIGIRTEKLAALDKQAAGHQDKVKGHEDAVAKLQGEIAKKKAEIERINAEVEEKGEREQVALHKEVEGLKVGLAVAQQRLATIAGELTKLADRRTDLERTAAELEAKIGSVDGAKADLHKRIALRESQIKDLDRKISDFKRKNNLEDAAELDAQVEALDKAADRLVESATALREEQQALVREKDRLEIALEGLDVRLEQLARLEKENKAQLAELREKKAAFKAATAKLSQAMMDLSAVHAQLETARTKLLSRREDWSKLRGRSLSIREQAAGHQAIDAVLKLKNPGILGPVSDLGQVSSEHALALEVAAGPRLRSIVVDTDKTAASCIRYLKDQKLGVATFLPLNKLRAPEAKPEAIRGEGVLGPALDMITYDKPLEVVFRYVLGNTIIVKDVETARRVGIGRVRMATLTGDLLEASGAMHGGYVARRKEGFGFQEKEVMEGLAALDKEIADLETTIASLERKKAAASKSIDEGREQKAHLEADIIKLEKTLHLDEKDSDLDRDAKSHAQKELRDVEKKLQAAEDEIAGKTAELAGLKAKKQALRAQITDLRNPAKLAELTTFEQQKAAIKDETSTLITQLRTQESELANILAPERESIQKILKQHDKEAAGFGAERTALGAELERTQAALKKEEEAEQQFYAQFKNLFTLRTKAADEANTLEGQVQQKQLSIRDAEQKLNAVSLEQARYKAELAGLEEEAGQYEGIPRFRSKSEDDIKLEIRQFERMASDMGAVNMKALEIYDRVEHEHRALQEKKEELRKEREDVLVMINEIDSKKKELFMGTFEVLNANFQKIFSTLSTKGEAYLDLEDPNDPFAAGLDIKVRLTGKRFLDIRSLSGGEKTLTALAFLFAVQEHEPASFYILDEVDAALDKRNSEKLAALIRSYTHKAQYIVISHNDGVISEADILYGISMNEHGMSKVTTLKI